MGSRSHDPAVSTPMTALCTSANPYRGHGLVDSVIIRHMDAYTDGRSRMRICAACGTQLGIDWERAWEREARKPKPESPKQGRRPPRRSGDDAGASSSPS